MKEQVRRDLYHIRDLLQSMDGLNKEEQKLNKSKKKLIEKKELISAPKNKKNPIVIVFLGLMLFALLFNTWRTHDLAMGEYESDAFNDEFAWKMNHIDDNEPYPGYDGKKPTLVSSMFKTLLFALPQSAGIAAAVGVVYMVWDGAQKKNREQQNKAIEEHNQRAELENPRIKRHNEDVNEEIRNLHARKKTISKRYMAEINDWFPADYAYPTAVNYFINLVEKNRIPCLYDDACSYEAYRMKVVNDAADKFDQYQAKCTEEQRHKELIAKEEQLLRQQMVGNMINMATFAASVYTANRVNDAANTVSEINRKIPRF